MGRDVVVVVVVLEVVESCCCWMRQLFGAFAVAYLKEILDDTSLAEATVEDRMALVS